MRNFCRKILFVLLVAVAHGAVSAGGARADTTVKELARVAGQGESVLQGLGVVMGLPGTGDNGKDPLIARPLSRILENNFNPVERLSELASVKSVALVMVTCRTPAIAARADDKYDVTVTTVGTASSLKGGVLYLTPLTEPRPGGKAYAIASGKIDIEDSSTPTTGKVRLGGQIIRDLPAAEIGNSFELIIEPHIAGWNTAKLIASVINENAQPQGPAVAFAMDERTVRVDIPEHERRGTVGGSVGGASGRAKFLDTVMSAPIPTSLLDLPAEVICNPRTGVIIMTGDVEISPGLISHRDLVISTVIPTPQPSVLNPIVERTRYTTLDTQKRPKDLAKLSDLLAAFKQLDIPTQEQIEVLQLLHKTGRLHARLILE